ncbi:hypothetical protein ACFQ22_01610 [Lentilactobacillus raoultii]|uniref:Uncharacterized protein n=1 Tax=Lentilactobacillus raoultii TaxID=1987503 RepID=A0ABW3PH45_9LACO|nr:hypothetical protein [Lentilactobacillus raoultii]
MKLKKLILSILLFTTLLFMLPTTPAQAATWHLGMPKILQGKWKTKLWKPAGKYATKGRAYLSIGKKHLTYSPANAPVDPQEVFKVHYRHSGDIYTISGRDFTNAPKGGFKQVFKIKAYNRHKIYFKILNNFRKDNNHVYYKY